MRPVTEGLGLKPCRAYRVLSSNDDLRGKYESNKMDGEDPGESSDHRRGRNGRYSCSA